MQKYKTSSTVVMWGVVFCILFISTPIWGQDEIGKSIQKKGDRFYYDEVEIDIPQKYKETFNKITVDEWDLGEGASPNVAVTVLYFNEKEAAIYYRYATEKKWKLADMEFNEYLQYEPSGYSKDIFTITVQVRRVIRDSYYVYIKFFRESDKSESPAIFNLAYYDEKRDIYLSEDMKSDRVFYFGTAFSKTYKKPIKFYWNWDEYKSYFPDRTEWKHKEKGKVKILDYEVHGNYLYLTLVKGTGYVRLKFEIAK
ncbi:MAG: hypothetical protein OEV94_10135 [Deltaproteobacteria bacterium]|nr:hypothetical protein [Deltaproteobacteria bacterium]MDH4122050.1 hypothetical protein [Deltaproteobacteria bacterium]